MCYDPSGKCPRETLKCGIVPHPLENEDLRQYYILVTRRCNANCPYCIEFKVRTGGFMSEQNLINALEKARELDMQTIYLHGGEPTMHPQIVHFAQLAKDAGFQVNMFTNGLKLDVVKALDGIVDEIRFSYEPGRDYMFQSQSEWKSVVKLYIMATTVFYPTEEDLMSVVNKALGLGMGVKVRTLNPIDDYSYQHQIVPYLHEPILNMPFDDLFCDGNKIAYRLKNGIIVRLGNMQLNPGHLKYSVTPEGQLQDHFDHSRKEQIQHLPHIEEQLLRFEPLRQRMIHL